MTNRSYQLQFCKICNHKKFDAKKGITCKLSNDYPAFEATCPTFEKNVVEENREKIRLQEKEVVQNTENFTYYKTKIRPLLWIFALVMIGVFMIAKPQLFHDVDIHGRKVLYKMLFKAIWGIPAGIITLIIAIIVSYNYYKKHIAKNKIS